jgi:hypothetical protein
LTSTAVPPERPQERLVHEVVRPVGQRYVQGDDIRGAPQLLEGDDCDALHGYLPRLPLWVEGDHPIAEPARLAPGRPTDGTRADHPEDPVLHPV